MVHLQPFQFETWANTADYFQLKNIKETIINQMDTVLLRIKEITINEGITIGSLEKRIGASKGVLSRAIKNGSDIQAKWLQKIVEIYPRYSSFWLLTGHGDMINQNVTTIPKNSFEKKCSDCKKNEQRISDLLETISSLKETNTVQKELIAEIKKHHLH
jgi:hypothetical protein